MGDRKVYRTYGRHRHCMISIDIWNDNDNHDVFSISSGTEVSESGKRSTRPDAQSHQGKKRVRGKKTTGRNQLKKRCKKVSDDGEEWLGDKTSGIFKDSSPGLYDSSEWKSQNILSVHDTNKMLSLAQEKKPVKKKAAQKPAQQTQLKCKSGVFLQKEERKPKNKHGTNRYIKETSLNFSQFDSYDLLLDSSPYVYSGDSGSKKGLPTSKAMKVTLHSTPYQNLHKQFSLQNCNVVEDCVDNPKDLSDVSDIISDENADPSLRTSNVATRIGPKIQLESEEIMNRETSVKKTASNVQDGGSQNDEGISVLDQSSDIFFSAQSQSETTRGADLHSNMREYNASESLFDQSSVIGSKQCSNQMAVQNIGGKTSSASVVTSWCNNLSDLMSIDELEVGSKSHASSDGSQKNDKLVTCSQQKVDALDIIKDLRRLEANCKDQRHTPARFQTPAGHYTPVMLYTPASDMTRNHCFHAGQLSRDREKELTQEIYSSGQSLKVLITPLTVSVSDKLGTPVSQNKQRRFQRLQTPVRRIIKNAFVQTPSISPKSQKQLIEEIQNSGKSLQIILSPLSVSPAISAKDKVLYLCQQKKPVTFLQCIPRKIMQKCRKVGEGVYGEVFRSERNKRPIALKIIPIEGDDLVNDEQQKTFEEILPEIVITKELSALKDTEDCQTPNFVHMQRVSLVRGTFPAKLLKEWDIFHAAKGSDNDRPDFYDGNQLFIVFEFEDCGTDLSSFEISNMQQVKSILQQVVASLAVAEEALQFEHRDLHWGNVLLKPTTCRSFNYRLQGKPFSIESHGIRVAIIDFTLSRLCKDGCSIFTDLSADLTLFQGVGDYQFEVYRLMKEATKNNWECFRPFTNLLWIKYLTDKLLNQKSCSQKAGRQSRAINKQLEELFEEVLNYSDARHLLIKSRFF